MYEQMSSRVPRNQDAELPVQPLLRPRSMTIAEVYVRRALPSALHPPLTPPPPSSLLRVQASMSGSSNDNSASALAFVSAVAATTKAGLQHKHKHPLILYAASLFTSHPTPALAHTLLQKSKLPSRRSPEKKPCCPSAKRCSAPWPTQARAARLSCARRRRRRRRNSFAQVALMPSTWRSTRCPWWGLLFWMERGA
jgi:hypothetical protein